MKGVFFFNHAISSFMINQPTLTPLQFFFHHSDCILLGQNDRENQLVQKTIILCVNQKEKQC